MENFRDKFVLEHLKIIDQHQDKLTDWEKEFIPSMIEGRSPEGEFRAELVTTGEYNTLMEIAEAVLER